MHKGTIGAALFVLAVQRWFYGGLLSSAIDLYNQRPGQPYLCRMFIKV